MPSRSRGSLKVGAGGSTRREAAARPGAKSDAAPRKAGKRYLELVRECPLIPIRDEAELDRAIAMIDRLIDQRGLTQEEEDYQTVLAGLVHNYESFHEPIPEVSPAEMLEHLIDVRGVTQGAVAAAVGVSDAAISQVLSGKRRPGRKLMAALAAYFCVDPSVFL